MTEDIVQRLRSYHYEYPKICGEAADEIERLRKENAAITERCAQVADRHHCGDAAAAIRALKDQ